MSDDKEMRKGAWSPEEDEQLVQLVRQHGPQNWSTIAAGMDGRTGKSCRLRWINQLNPAVNKEPFTEWEDAVIILAHRKVENQWSKIARMLPARTDNSVKNHWNSTLKRKVANGTLKNRLIEAGATLEFLLNNPPQSTVRPGMMLNVSANGKDPLHTKSICDQGMSQPQSSDSQRGYGTCQPSSPNQSSSGSLEHLPRHHLYSNASFHNPDLPPQVERMVADLTSVNEALGLEPMASADPLVQFPSGLCPNPQVVRHSIALPPGRAPWELRELSSSSTTTTGMGSPSTPHSRRLMQPNWSYPASPRMYREMGGIRGIRSVPDPEYFQMLGRKQCEPVVVPPRGRGPYVPQFLGSPNVPVHCQRPVEPMHEGHCSLPLDRLRAKRSADLPYSHLPTHPVKMARQSLQHTYVADPNLMVGGRFAVEDDPYKWLEDKGKEYLLDPNNVTPELIDSAISIMQELEGTRTGAELQGFPLQNPLERVDEVSSPVLVHSNSGAAKCASALLRQGSGLPSPHGSGLGSLHRPSLDSSVLLKWPSLTRDLSIDSALGHTLSKITKEMEEYDQFPWASAVDSVLAELDNQDSGCLEMERLTSTELWGPQLGMESDL